MTTDQKIEKLIDVVLDMFMYENGDDVARTSNTRILSSRFGAILRQTRTYYCPTGCAGKQRIETNNPFANCSRCGERLVCRMPTTSTEAS